MLEEIRISVILSLHSFKTRGTRNREFFRFVWKSQKWTWKKKKKQQQIWWNGNRMAMQFTATLSWANVRVCVSMCVCVSVVRSQEG